MSSTPYPPYARDALRSAGTLPQLHSAAMRVGLGDALKAPCAPLAANPDVPPDAARLLANLMAAGAVTLGDVLSPGRMQGIVGNTLKGTRDRLLAAVRRELEAALEIPAPKPQPKRAPPAPRAPRAAEKEQRPRDRQELQRWAEEHGVAPLLKRRLDRELRGLPEDLRMAGRYDETLTLAELIVPGRGGNRLEFLLGRSRSERVAETAWRFLVKQAADHQAWEAQARVEDAQLPLPSEPTLRTVVEHLRTERERLRQLNGFLPEPQGVLVSVLDDPPRLMVAGGDVDAPMVVPLEAWELGPLHASHGTARNFSAEFDDCDHALLAVDAVLRLLCREPEGAVARQVAETLRTPRWAKDLKQLLAIHERHDKQRAPAVMQLAWRLRPVGDAMELLPVLQKQTKRGNFTSGSAVAAHELVDSPDVHPSPAERRALQLLAGHAEVWQPGGAQQHLRALEQLVGHPRVTLATDGRDRDAEPLTVRTGRVGLAVAPTKGGALTLSPTVDGQPAPALARALTGVSHGRGRALRVALLSSDQKEVSLLRVTPESRDLILKLHERQPSFPPEATDELLAFTGLIGTELPVDLPPSLRGEELPDAKLLVLRLTTLGETGLHAEVLCRPVLGGPAFPPGEGLPETYTTVDGRRVFARRDLAAEVERARELTALLRLRSDEEESAFHFDLERQDDALDLVTRLAEAPHPSLVVEWSGRPWSVTRAATTQQLRVEVGRRRDWFGLDGTLDVDGERVRLAVVLDTLRRKQRYVRVSPERFVALSQRMREQLAPLAAGTFVHKEELTLGPAAALALEEVIPELAAVTTDESFATFRERVRAARAMEPALPADFRASLRPYQHDGFRWMARMAQWGAGACLADDMGLGKTVQALALLQARHGEGPALVVAPTSVCRNWMDEAARFAPALKARLYREIPEAEREGAVAGLGAGDLLVISYGMLVRELSRLAARTWATLVVDEAQAVKNVNTQRAQACRELDAAFRLALTGTPLENHLGELWSLYRVVFPGLLGSWEEFRERFAGPIERDGDNERRVALASLCRPFLLRRTKAQVAPELPPRTDMTVLVEPSPAERRLYEQARLAAAAQVAGLAEVPEEKRRFQVLAALTRLRLCACHPRLYDENSAVTSSKVTRLMELVDELREEGHRALVFSQFTSLLGLVREELDRRNVRYLYLDGQTPAAKRDELVRLFQAGQGGELFLISLKAGGTGLNLTAATYVIHLDPWWNPAVEDQASDRAHRIGQQRPVTVMRLVTEGTVEQQILSLHQDKRALVAGVLEGTEAAGRLSTSELMDLIQTGAVRGGEEPGDDEIVSEAPARTTPRSPAPSRARRTAEEEPPAPQDKVPAPQDKVP
ncbi:MAG: DEAD/DEAH box helicase, partial [Myxococcota bacterium]